MLVCYVLAVYYFYDEDMYIRFSFRPKSAYYPIQQIQTKPSHDQRNSHHHRRPST